MLPAVNKNELALLFQEADVGLQILRDIPAFYYGTSPNKFFDYLACGLPVLTNYPGWIAEIIEKARCGIAVQASDPQSFGEKLLTLQSDPNLLREMSKRASDTAIKQYSWETMSGQWLSFVADKAFVEQ